jgi:predicted ferric reductase
VNVAGGSGTARAYRPAAPDRSHRLGRRLCSALCWLTLGLGLGLWWVDTPAGSLTGSAEVLTAAGRITGLVAGYVLLLQVLLMSRVGWLERWVGAHDLLQWHRELGGFLVLGVLAHTGLTLVGYARTSRTSVSRETWLMLTTYQDMVSAFLATGIVVATGVLALRALRRRLPYEVWYYLHLSTYLVLLLGYGHQFAYGQELTARAAGRWYWLLLYLGVLACLAWGRLVAPLLLNLRHRLRVLAVTAEGADTISIYIGGRRLGDLQVRAGQFFRWRFLAPGCRWQAHPFSLSAAPNEHWLRLTVKIVGDHTERLRDLAPGVRVLAEGPSGVFTAERRQRTRALLIAGGSGIAPIRALLEELPSGPVVIYRASTEADLVFRRELDALTEQRGGRVWYVLGGRDDPLPRRLFTPRGLRELVPDVGRRDVYLCGPQGLVDTSRRVLRRLRVPRRQIHCDPFEF